MVRAAVDIGGTFTDLVHLDEETGAVGLGKTLTTPGRFDDGVMEVLRAADLDSVSFLVHGTTVVINALTERTGARTALITTRGFRDVLEIGRANRPDLYNFSYRKPLPYVPRRRRLEVTERVTYKGEVDTPLLEQDVRDAVAEARRQGADAIAICFLHAYANPEHERRAAEIVRAEWPEAGVSASHELTNEWREYERTSTAVLDAYVKPVVRGYLGSLGRRMSELGVDERARYAMRSNGGISSFARAADTPINLVESGPVGGVIGAAEIGRLLGEDNLMTFDLGGTTAKSSLVEQGAVSLTGEYHIDRSPGFAGYPIKVPVVDIVEIGAGGGSLAWLDAAGALNVGPRSAGADPGPACYGRGGTQPTLTDANLLAGRINADYFLGGDITLDTERAAAAFASVAEALGTGVAEAAVGVIRLANARMVSLLKLVSVQRGRDPRDFAIVAFGGGGPLHATALARDLRIPRVIVPPAPGHFSAWGMLAGDLRHDIVQTKLTRLRDADAAALAVVWRELTARMESTFGLEGVAGAELILRPTADMRYVNQEHTVNVPVPDGELDADGVKTLEARFHALHEQRYTFRLESGIEVVNFRLTGFAAVRKPELRAIPVSAARRPEPLGVREVDFDEHGRLETSIHRREELGAGAEVQGPAVIEETATSTLVFPGQRLQVDRTGNLIVSTEA